jgi:hypothetical protein
MKNLDEIENCSLYFYIPMKANRQNEEYLYFDSPSDELYNIRGVSMNNSFIFFWNEGIIWQMDLINKNIRKLSLYISEEEKQTFIRKVRCLSRDDNLISIRITQSSTENVIIQWNLECDKEIASFDVENSALTFQDPNGHMYINQGDTIISCGSGCKLKCYQSNSSDFTPGKFGF